MCLKCFALEQSLHVSWHSTAYSAYFKHWELFKVNFKKHNGPRNEKWVHRNHTPKKFCDWKPRSDTKKLLQPTGLKNNLGQGIYPKTTVSLFIFKTRDVTSGVNDPLKPVRPGLLNHAGILFCSLLVSPKSRWKWSTVQAKQKIPAKHPRVNLTRGWRGIRKKTQKHFTQAELPEKFKQKKEK